MWTKFLYRFRGALFAFVILYFGLLTTAVAGDHGRGTLGRDLLDFKPILDERVIKLNESILEKVNRLDLSDVPQLKDLSAELLTPILEMTEDAYKNPNQYPGDWREGGLLYGYTDLIPGAPTMIYPIALLPINQGGLSDVQLKQLLIHEALHRTLPVPLNGIESLVVSLTRIILLHAENRVASAAKTVLARFANLDPHFPIEVRLNMDKLKKPDATPRLDSVKNSDGFETTDIYKMIDGLTLKVKNRISLDFYSGKKMSSRFAIELDFSSVALAPYIYSPQNWESLHVYNGDGNYKKWYVDGSIYYLITDGQLKIKITDNFNPDRKQFITASLQDLKPDPKLLKGKTHKYKISEIDYYGGYKNRPYTSLRNEEYQIFSIDQLRATKNDQAEKLNTKIKEALTQFFESVDFERPTY
jgi:hypothetical protein